jgi:crotonobetainyl-CoA:carnitine CoA-transferase CaiB-like acyl-CoA transferase
MVSAVLAALLHRERSGRGQRIDTSLLLSSAHLMNYFYSEFWVDGVSRKAMGTANHLSVPNQVFPSKDGSVVIIAPSDAMWRRCARALDPGTLDLPAYRSITDRQRHRAEVIAAITAVTTRHSSDELVRILGDAKVNVAKVNTVGEAASDLQLEAARGTVAFTFGGETVKAVSSPFHLSRTPVEVRQPPPRLDEHRAAVLDLLGYDEAAIAGLAASGAFGPSD